MSKDCLNTLWREHGEVITEIYKTEHYLYTRKREGKKHNKRYEKLLENLRKKESLLYDKATCLDYELLEKKENEKH